MTDVPSWLGTLSPLGALVLIMILIARGDLVPKSTVTFMREVLGGQLADAREAAAAEKIARTTQQEINAEHAEAIHALAEGQETIVAFIQAMPRPSEDGHS